MKKDTFLFSDVLGFESVAQNVNHVCSEVEIVEGRSKVVARRHLKDFVLNKNFKINTQVIINF
jgi:hypothetical protein